MVMIPICYWLGGLTAAPQVGCRPGAPSCVSARADHELSKCTCIAWWINNDKVVHDLFDSDIMKGRDGNSLQDPNWSTSNGWKSTTSYLNKVHVSPVEWGLWIVPHLEFSVLISSSKTATDSVICGTLLTWLEPLGVISQRPQHNTPRQSTGSLRAHLPAVPMFDAIGRPGAAFAFKIK